MKSLDLIAQLDNKPNYERLKIIVGQLEILGVDYYKQEYSTGTNLMVDLGKGDHRIGVSSHFDRVQQSAGANDNGSAIAVCLDLIKKHKHFQADNLALRVFFFDEEENGLKGSTAYVEEIGLKNLTGLINMELVGLGDKIALWPVTHEQHSSILENFQLIANRNGIESFRFDRIITNTADHLPFQRAGLDDSFTVTCISGRDLEVAQEYFSALELGFTTEKLFEILSKAPIFAHYHNPTDTYEKLMDNSIHMTSSVIWETIIKTQISDC